MEWLSPTNPQAIPRHLCERHGAQGILCHASDSASLIAFACLPQPLRRIFTQHHSLGAVPLIILLDAGRMASSSDSHSKRLTLSGWAQIAEITASVAVVVTLILLVIEVRENTDITRASAYAHSIELLSDWRNATGSDPDLLRVFTAYQVGEAHGLGPDDRMRLELVLSGLWGIYENAFYARDYGTLGAAEWDRFGSRICANLQMGPALWEEMVRPRLTEEFVTHVESSC